MYKISITQLASKDLEEIIAYICNVLCNVVAATAFIQAVDNCYNQVESNPLIYEQCRNKRLHSLQYRRAVIKNYVMVYKVDEQSKTVYILRFFYGARDYEKLI